MAEQIIRALNTPGRIEEGFRVLQGKKEYVTYLDDSSFRLWYSNIPWRYESHYHSAVEILMTVKGTVEYEVGGRKYVIHENEILIVPPDTEHGLSMGEGSSRYLFLFEPDTIFSMSDMKPLSGGFNKVFFLNDGSDTHIAIRDILQRAIDVYEEQDLMWNTVCYSCMMQMYALLGQKYLAGVVRPKHESENHVDSEIITSTLTYISNHYRDELTLDHVAEFAGFSRYYFSRTFKKHTGFSFKDFLCQKRLQVAMDLLIHTNKSMRDVAVESGFGSVATFNRVFRDHKNCTPTQYRAIYGSY